MSDWYDYYLLPLSLLIILTIIFSIVFINVYQDNEGACNILDTTEYNHSFENGNCVIIYNGEKIIVNKNEAFEYSMKTEDKK